MIVRISGEDQYELDDASIEPVNELEREVLATVDSDRADDFPTAYAALLDYVRGNGVALGDDDLRGSDLILPPADISFAEAGREFTGEGLIPGLSPVSSPADFNAGIIEEFRAHGGRVGGPFTGTPLLLLHHTGARSGTERVNPLAYLGDGGRYVVFASKAGAPTNPDWYHNLRAHPNTTIEVGADTLDVVASEATGEERERLYRAQAQRVPQFAEYEAKAGRTIPVIVLTLAAGG